MTLAILPLTITATVALGIGSGYLAITFFLRSFGRHRVQQPAPATVAIPVAGD